jgi:flagellar capping protein FliD
MSLVFAIIIFIFLLFGSVFACGNVQSPRVYEQFLDYPTDIKIQVATTFSDYEKKLTDADEKKKINGIIEKINNNKIGVEELSIIIKELTKIAEIVEKNKATSTGEQPIPMRMRIPASNTNTNEEAKKGEQAIPKP